MKLGFSRLQRLVSRDQFRATYRNSNRFVGQKIIANYRMGKAPNPKLGITIGRKWGKAHQRNRFKRVVREAYRHLYPEMPVNLELNIHPQISYETLTVWEMQRELKCLMTEIHGQTQSKPTESSRNN